MKFLKYFPLLFTLLLLYACLPTMQIEETGIVNSRGVDIVEVNGERMIETTIIPYLFDPNADEISSILVGRAHTIKQARQDAGNQTSYSLAPGQIRLEIYGKEAAEAGILVYLNTLIRDARVSDTMQLAVTNMTAREILETEQETIKINTSQYLQDLLSKEREINTIPKNSLHAFARTVEQVGLDPTLPIIDVVDKYPTLTGIALFQHDRYVGNTNLSDAILINIMLEHIQNAPLEAAIPAAKYEDLIFQRSGEERSEESELIYIYLSSTRGKGNIKIKNTNTLHYQADILLQAEALETSVPMNITSKEISEKIERDIEEYFEGQYESLITKLQEVNADIFGLGQLYTATREGSKTTQEEWIEKYPQVRVDFNVEFTITNFGTVN